MVERIKIEELSKENILAFGEIYQGKLHHASLEILTPLKEIAEKLNKKLILLCLAESVEKIQNLEEIKQCIADEVWFILNKELDTFKDDLFAEVVIEIIKNTKPYGLFFPATFAGTSIAPRIAGSLSLGLCAHVNALEVEEDKIVMSRPTYGENIIAKLSSRTLPIMATLSAGVFPIKSSEKAPVFKEVMLPQNFSWKSRLKVRKFNPSEKQPTRLTTAKVVIAGGRGLKNKENFQKLFELAEFLKGEVGATRPACYEGWIEEERMIGVSGVSVHPKVYIGFGISGALQHTVGMESSEFIIAINTDKEAPLVKMAHLALIGDAPKILGLLIKRLKSLSK